MQSLDRLPTLTHYSLLLLIMLYILAPAKNILGDELHRISHALSNTDTAPHRHKGAGMTHDHEHSVLQFFSRILEHQNDEDPSTLLHLSTLDKHLPQPTITYILPTVYTPHKFLYLEHSSEINHPTPYPPPQV